MPVDGSQSIQAVVNCNSGRNRCVVVFYYMDWFNMECMRRYHAGEKPTAQIREAVSNFKIIGCDRIERAFARWKHTPNRGTCDTTDPRDHLIAAQALRIQQLEEELHALKQA